MVLGRSKWWCLHTSEVRTMLETVLAARMCDLTASLPCCLCFLPWLGALVSWVLSLWDCGVFVLSDNDERSAVLVFGDLSCCA